MKKGCFRVALCICLAGALACAQQISRVSSNDLKGDLSFLASDALQGRYTPSPFLDVAAEFVASRFRALGLDELPGGGYFQEAHMTDRTSPAAQGPLTVSIPGKQISVEPSDYRIVNIAAPLDLKDAPVVIAESTDAKVLDKIDAKGKILLVRGGSWSSTEAVQKTGASAVILVGTSHHFHVFPMLFENTFPVPVLSVHSEALAEQVNAAEGEPGWKVSVEAGGPLDHQVTLRNVGGVLPGSDPALKKQFVLITAHYDHIGTGDTAAPFAETTPTTSDRIYNGANDDGSGTVSVLAIAKALRNAHPRRTVVFLLFFGEERGLIGSTYYAHHPLFPLAQTVADLNLEQLGRFDEMEDGKVTPHPKSLTLTGFRFTTLAATLSAAGSAQGIRVYENVQNSDRYFLASDNAALSRAGIPSTSVSTAFEFPDYHGTGDEWQKIDYANMSKVDDTIAHAALTIANASSTPAWNAQNPKTESYREAYSSLKKRQ